MRTKVTCKCTTEGYSKKIYASPLYNGGTFFIKSFNSDTILNVRASNKKKTSPSWMASKLMTLLRDNLDMKPKVMRGELQNCRV